MKEMLRRFYFLDKNTRQNQLVGLLISSFVLGIISDVFFNGFLFPFGIIKLALNFFFFTYFAIHVYLLLKDRENMKDSARWIAIVLAFVVSGWFGNIGSLTLSIVSNSFLSARNLNVFVYIYGSFLLNQLFNEESEHTSMKDPRYSLPEFKPTQQNTDMTPKKHTVNPTEQSTSVGMGWYCPSCGEAIPKHSKRCPKCKEKIDF